MSRCAAGAERVPNLGQFSRRSDPLTSANLETAAAPSTLSQVFATPLASKIPQRMLPLTVQTGRPLRIDLRFGFCPTQMQLRVAQKSHMPTPQAKIDRVQRLSAAERLWQPSPEDWLTEQDRLSREDEIANDEGLTPPSPNETKT